MKPRATMKTNRLMRSVLIAHLGSFSLVMVGCQAPATPASPNRSEQAMAAVAGQDGPRTITAANTIVNAYAVLGANAAATTTAITVTNIAQLAPTGFTALAQGDLLLIIQMAGATMNALDGPAYGTVNSLGGAGRYEFAGVESVSGNQITLTCGLRNSYTMAGRTQVVRVPQYTTLTIALGASIVAPAWDGARGGIVAVHANITLGLNGQINVSGLGFRGGATENETLAAGSNVVTYRNILPTYGAEKGESIVGDVLTYDTFNGRYGRGAPANGGGGGNSHNGGGGGGANGRSGLTWSGQGVMLSSVVGAAAWSLDPGYIANGNALTNSEGGGRGGYTYGDADLNALTVGPGDNTWLGDSRREAGGLGGHALDNDPSSRLFMGGGGGAGDGNNNTAGKGGNGGGMVFVIAGSVTGAGSILAQGEVGANATGNPGDAPGGGGGGGTVLVRAESIPAITINVDGGNGGNQTNSNGVETEGPGGGGGDGYIAVYGGTPIRSAAGGLGGTTNRPSLAEFPSNGATAGNAGQTNGNALTLQYCGDAVAPETTIETHPENPTNQTNGTFTFSSNDPLAIFECQVDTGAFAQCPATFPTGVLTEGPHTILVRARDLSGNVDATPATFPWIVDTTAPDTTITGSPTNPTTALTGTFTFSSNDTQATFECSLNSATYVACPGTFTTPTLTVGTQTISVRARDLAGNVDATPATFPWVITVAPDAGAPDAPLADASGTDSGDAQSAFGDAQDTLPSLDSGPADVARDAPGPDTTIVVPTDTAVVVFLDAAPTDTTPDSRTDVVILPVTDASPEAAAIDTRTADTQVTDAKPATPDTLAPDTALIISPADAAITPDAAATLPKVVAMGSGFCAVGVTQNRSPLPFLMLLGMAGLVLVARRRR